MAGETHGAGAKEQRSALWKQLQGLSRDAGVCAPDLFTRLGPALRHLWGISDNDSIDETRDKATLQLDRFIAELKKSDRVKQNTRASFNLIDLLPNHKYSTLEQRQDFIAEERRKKKLPGSSARTIRRDVEDALSEIERVVRKELVAIGIDPDRMQSEAGEGSQYVTEVAANTGPRSSAPADSNEDSLSHSVSEPTSVEGLPSSEPGPTPGQELIPPRKKSISRRKTTAAIVVSIALLALIVAGNAFLRSQPDNALSATLLSIDQNPPAFAFEDPDKASDFVDSINPALHLDDHFNQLRNTSGVYAVGDIEVHVQLKGVAGTVTVYDIKPQIIGGKDTGRHPIVDGALLTTNIIGGEDPPHRMTFIMEDPNRTAREEFSGALGDLEGAVPFFGNNPPIELSEGDTQEIVLNFHSYLYAYDFEVEISYEANGKKEKVRVRDGGDAQVFRLTAPACPNQLQGLTKYAEGIDFDATVQYEKAWRIASFGSAPNDPNEYCAESGSGA